jgi:hypothetical protein
VIAIKRSRASAAAGAVELSVDLAKTADAVLKDQRDEAIDEKLGEGRPAAGPNGATRRRALSVLWQDEQPTG